MTDLQRAYLKMFKPDTYGIAIPRGIAREMIENGWLEWVPEKFGHRLYAITEAGRKAIGAAL